MNLLTLALSLVVQLSNTLGTARASAPDNSVALISWSACDPPVSNDTSITCGFLDVPLDYQNRSVGTVTLALAKISAPEERIGTVLMNPGGPGVSGIDSLELFKQPLVSRTGGRYDIISWDPRGVGNRTTPGDILCFNSSADYLSFFNRTIQISGINMTGNFTDPGDITALFVEAGTVQDKFEETMRRCLAHNGELLRYVGTASSARDVASIFDAIDGPGSKINFIGASYGSLMGIWLVNMFPDRVGRVILDGIVDPSLIASAEDSIAWLTRQLADSQAIYDGFVTGCALSGPSGCAIASSLGANATAIDVDAKIQDALKTAHDAERLNPGLPLTSGVFRIGMYSMGMVAVTTWSSIANGLIPQAVDAIQAEVSMPANNTAQRAAESLTQSIRNVTLMANSDNVPLNLYAMLCSDSVDPDSATNMTNVFKSIVSLTRNKAPMCWPNGASACAAWSLRAVERYMGPFNRPLTNKIIVASNIYDPTTPLVSAQNLAGLLSNQAALVRVNGFGHTTFNSGPSSCMDSIAEAYMVNGTLPEEADTLCDVDTDFEVFPGVNTQAILSKFAVGSH